ncbi:MAG: DNA polymerase III subunit beta [Anaerolineales bacterium]|nr:DNA polymerase III subunit beta [Anaerolineales bacterium]
MKATVKQQQLAHGVNVVARAVAPRSTLPVLSNILIKTDEGRLRLSATNLELGITTWIGANVQSEGAITVPARTFSDLISNLPNEDVLLTLDPTTRTLNVNCGSSNTDIKGIDAEEFPPIPEPDLTNTIPLNVENFKEMIQQVAFAASTDDSRPMLTGIHLTSDGDKLSMAATDGFRISVRTAVLADPLPNRLEAIIPARAMTELARVATDGNETLLMNFPPERGQVIFHMKDIELVSQLIDGTFPDYKAIIPPSFKTHTILSTSGLLAACKQAEIIARDSTNVAQLDIQPESDGQKSATLEISAVSEQTGSSEITVDASIDGTPLLVAFNVRFLREVLEVIKTANVLLETNAANSPGMIRPVGDEYFRHIIMPMHLG